MADVELATDGRLTLTGNYKDRNEVEIAFAIARSVVGVRRLAPTTPERIRERLSGAQQAFQDAIGRIPAGRPAPSTPKRQPEPAKHALVVGINSFTKAAPLLHAEKDARDYYALLVDPKGGAVPPDNITLLVGREATAKGIKNGLEKISDRAGPGDRVYAMFSTHGTPNALGRFDLIATDSEFSQGPQGAVYTNRETVVTDEDLIGFVSSLSQRGAIVYLVLDACYSGKAFASVPGFLPVRSRDLFVEEERYATGMSVKSMKDYAGNRATPVVMISASGENERSWDSDELRNGVFTHYFLRELKDRRDVRRAFDASFPIVTREAPRLVLQAAGRRITQTPQMYVQPADAEGPL
jgi:hypothetical protein